MLVSTVAESGLGTGAEAGWGHFRVFRSTSGCGPRAVEGGGSKCTRQELYFLKVDLV